MTHLSVVINKISSIFPPPILLLPLTSRSLPFSQSPSTLPHPQPCPLLQPLPLPLRRHPPRERHPVRSTRSPLCFARSRDRHHLRGRGGDPHPEADPAGKEHYQFSESQSEPLPTMGEVLVKLDAKMKKSASDLSMFVHIETKEVEVVPRTATMRPRIERREAKAEEEEDNNDDEGGEVDARADDFINQFRQQLKLQWLNSIMRYKEIFFLLSSKSPSSSASPISGVLLNLVIGTIVLTSKTLRSHRHRNDDHHHHPRPISRGPFAVIKRLRSIGLYRFRSGDFHLDATPPSPKSELPEAPDASAGGEQQHRFSQCQSNPQEKDKEKRMKKSPSENSTFTHFEEVEIVRRPTALRRSGRAALVVEEEVNARADDFINWFKQQVKLQRLDSILRFKEMLNRGK